MSDGTRELLPDWSMGRYHSDDEINAEVAVGARAGEAADLAAGFPPSSWECECGARHSRGHYLTIGTHRCLACGYVGIGGALVEGSKDA